MSQIRIDTLLYDEPFVIYLCNGTQTTCIYIDTIFSFQLPYYFVIPPILDGQTQYVVKATDAKGCEVTQFINTVPIFI